MFLTCILNRRKMPIYFMIFLTIFAIYSYQFSLIVTEKFFIFYINQYLFMIDQQLNSINMIPGRNPISLSSQISQKKLHYYEQVQRELNKWKFHLRMKKKLYDNTEYQNVSQRVKNCESYFKAMRSTIINKQANRILRKDRPKKHSSVKKQPLSMKRQFANHSTLVDNKSQKQERYIIRLKNQQEELSNSRFIVEYQLRPLQLTKKGRPDHASNGKQTEDQRLGPKDGRFVSQFEKNIRQKLQKIQLKKYSDIQQFDEIIRRSQEKQTNNHKKQDKISKTNPLKQQYPSPNHNSLRQKNTTICRQGGKTTETILQQRSESLRSKIDRCRTQLSQRQRNEIDLISHKNIDYNQKNRILSNYYQKYSSNSKYGDPQALNLMSIATIARADLLLQQI